jgi:hypothetical protein
MGSIAVTDRMIRLQSTVSDLCTGEGWKCLVYIDAGSLTTQGEQTCVVVLFDSSASFVLTRSFRSTM